ncbi:hypothetical protein CALVIDRAFT_534007 [Calocera viscosa TUFC12733]|uniref:Uncharacterized protein n=1 Tax=Calocera viscosa (strain TUFC12733) TaxID=1330018 RepID=A0A167QB82_CALVF|nr:hypothetical protein CALVIDRAFT_534007 [Calocera viscosa TUFC12733]
MRGTARLCCLVSWRSLRSIGRRFTCVLPLPPRFPLVRGKETALTLVTVEQAAYPKHTDGAWPGRVVEVLNNHTPWPAMRFPPRVPKLRRPAAGDGDVISLDERDEMDPHGYTAAKKKIKKALQEYYRGLELLDNYRVRAAALLLCGHWRGLTQRQILNLTGFRKALKKFEKVTGILFAQQLYMDERVEPLPLANPETLHSLRLKMEVVYADRFAKGDRKRARDRLRADVSPHTHHFSTFRAGVFIGLAVPAIVLGVVRCELFRLAVGCSVDGRQRSTLTCGPCCPNGTRCSTSTACYSSCPCLSSSSGST